MKKTLMVILLAVFCVLSTDAQTKKWVFKKLFYKQSMPHGLAVTADNRVWVACYGASGDTLGPITSMRSVLVLNPDGSVFKRVQTLTIGGVTDTMKVAARGIAVDNNGDILYSAGSSLYRINSKTYAGMNKATHTYSLTCAAASSDGYVFVGPVLNGYPILIYGTDFTLIGNAVDTTKQIARVLAVSSDGKDIYHGSTTGSCVVVYHTDLVPLGPWAPTDSIKPIMAEAITWRAGKLWMGNRDSNAIFPKKWSWVEWDPNTKQFTGQIIQWDTTGMNKLGLPRGIAFTPKGDTGYVCGFDGGWVQMFAYEAVSVEREHNIVASEFNLSQNYPNPFNPTTEIKFTLANNGLTTVKVYDLMGREVATLVNEFLTKGSYKTTFDAKNLASGTYIYRLTSGNMSLAKKMVVLK